MRKFSILAVAAVLGFPAMAFAGDYGTTGVIEVGGEVSIQSDSTAIKPKGGSESTNTLTSIRLAPEVGYFLMDQLELIGALRISSSSTGGDGAKSSSSGFGLGVGAAYLLPLGGIHAGPRATLGFGSDSVSSGEGAAKVEYSTAGPEINLGGVAKVPFGTGGILGAGLNITFAPKSISGDFKGDSTTTGFGLGTSFSVYW